jgi:HEAT repeat protein
MGIEVTFTLLAENGSPAAIGAVVEALSEPNATIQAKAVSVLLSREVRRGLKDIVQGFHSFDTPTQSRVEREIQFLMPILRDLLSTGTEQARLNVIDIVKRSRELEPLRLAVQALEDPFRTVREQAASAIVEEAERIGRRSLRSRGVSELGIREVAKERRQKMASLLADALDAYAGHKERRLLYALLELGAEAMPILVNRLIQANHPASEDFVAIVRNSASVQVIDILMRLLLEKSERARRLGAEAFGTRGGRVFGRAIADWLLSLEEPELAARASRCHYLPWLAVLFEHLWDLEPRTHLRMLRFIDNSRMSDTDKAAWANKLVTAPDADVRLQAVTLLAKTATPVALEGLTRALSDQHEPVVKTALDALIAMNPPEKAKLLAPLLSSQFDSVRRLVSRELSRENFDRYMRSFDKLDPKTRELAGRAIAKIDPEMAEKLADELRSLDPERRLKALRITEVVDTERELEPILLELLADPSRKVRATVVRTVGLLGSIDAIKALIKTLSDQDRRTRANAIEAFEELGNPKFGALLLPFLADPDNRIRANAAKALWNLGHPETKQVLDEMLAEPNELMRLSAVWAMGEISYPGIRQILNDVAEHDASETVRQKARDILAGLEHRH